MASSCLNTVGTGPVSSSKDAEAILFGEHSLSVPFPLPKRSTRPAARRLKPPALAKQAARSLVTDRHSGANEPWFAQAFRSRWEAYRARLDEYRKEPSAESVHEMRVASRRLASQLMVLSCVVGGRKPHKIRRMLKRQLRSLGTLRDLHVQQRFLEQQASRFPGVVQLREELQRKERGLVRPAARRMSNSKIKRLQRWIEGLEEELAQVAIDATKQEKLEAAAWHCAEDAFAETVRCWRLISLSDLRTIHRTRVAFKKFRYIVESLPPEMSGLSKRQLRRLAYYQRKMGNIQDLEVIQECIGDFMDEDGTREAPLRSFCAYSRRRRARALRAFRDSAKKLLQFWPPPNTSAPFRSRATHYAAAW